jgi:hypothetical protein
MSTPSDDQKLIDEAQRSLDHAKDIVTWLSAKDSGLSCYIIEHTSNLEVTCVKTMEPTNVRKANR